MKSIRIPLASVNPSLVLRYVSKGAVAEAQTKSEGSALPAKPTSASSTSRASSVRTLLWNDINTPWLQPYFEERQLGEDALLEWDITLRREGGLVRAQVHLRQRPELECVRSLTLHRTLVESTQTALFTPTSSSGRSFDDTNPTRGERELTEDDLTEYEFDGTHLELDAFLLDALETSLPSFPLCRPDCLGLCSECGEALNDRSRCGKKGPNPTCEHFPSELQ